MHIISYIPIYIYIHTHVYVHVCTCVRTYIRESVRVTYTYAVHIQACTQYHNNNVHMDNHIVIIVNVIMHITNV